MLRFLPGTSVLKRLGHLEVRTAVEPLATTGQLGPPSICDLEVGDLARNAEEWDRLVGSLNALDRIESTAANLRRPLQVQRLLAQRGQRARNFPVLLITAAAEQLDVAVLHYAADFDIIASGTAPAEARADHCHRLVTQRVVGKTAARQFSAFLSWPGSEALYSGVAPRQRWRSRRAARRPPGPERPRRPR